MISNLTSQLNQNNNLSKLPQVLNEIPKVRKDLGMPPLVTPISQMVGAQAVSNVMTKRYENISEQVISYLSGNYGKPPGEINTVKFKKIKKHTNNKEIKSLKKYSDEIKDISQYLPDILTYALFDETGKNFLINKGKIYEKREINKPEPITNNTVQKSQDNQITIQFENKEYTISINVENEELVADIIKQSDITYEQNTNTKDTKTEIKTKPQIKQNNKINKFKFINTPMSGTVIKYLVKTNDKIKSNQEVAIIESMKMETTIKSDVDGTILELLIAPGGAIQAQEPIIKIN